MPVDIRVPSLGESVVEATIGRWLKHEGDTVNQGEALVELETDKVNMEVGADQSGVLQKIVKQEGDTVAVGEVLGVIGESSQAPATQAGDGQKIPSEQLQSEPVTSERQKVSTGQLPPTTRASDGQRPPSPLARRIASEYNVDLSQVKGTSPHGRVTKDDVIGYMEQHVQNTAPSQRVAQPDKASAPPPVQTTTTSDDQVIVTPLAAPRGREERIRLSRRRQTIAQRLVEAQHSAAMLTTFNEIDMSAVMEVRSRRKDTFKERHNVSLGFMSFFTKAVVGALKAFPRLNAEIQGNEMVLKRYYDIGIAVGAEEGLVVPVLRDADRKSFAEIEQEVAALANKARENSLALAELQGGTFTITNGGIFGSLLSTPILNAPQVGILGMHKIEQRPIAVNGQVVIRPMMYVALSYDHRIVDGREAVQFLVRVKELVEDPETLLLEG
ncbi:MAG: 2-oxoglutarate dehydrogenase complex dihydrolipoyllysine-residue succinyltransferase [Chloroflexi bacterium]|nr:MAG: 2-oxoglutarate dehydrogenase complex dihydrolipoyllysine-residue succinyltransferase [Chloroflexota bacterium]